MLTIGEFNIAANRHLRRVKWLFRVLAVLIAFNLMLVLFTNPGEWLRAHTHPNFPPWLVKPWGLYGLFFVVLLLAAWPLNMWARRDARLVCPQCDRGLFRSRYRVVGTGKCPHCHRDIISDPRPEQAPPFTRAEAQARANRQWRMIRDFFLGFAVMIFVVTPVGLGCDALVDAGWMSHAIAECIAAVMLAGILAWMVLIAVRLLRLSGTMVRCPRCGCVRDSLFVVKDGRCKVCGQQLVAEPADGMAAEAVTG